MKYLLLILVLLIAVSACQVVQTQTNTSQNTVETESNISNNQNNSEHYGYPKFTTSNKTYLGCWVSVKASEVVNYKLKYFQITEKTIQTSKMSKPVFYKENNSNSYKDYFVLKTGSKKNDLQQYLSINVVSNDEMTIQEFAIEKDITDGEGENYWALKRANCDKVKSNFKK
jgi:hypothetical protein